MNPSTNDAIGRKMTKGFRMLIDRDAMRGDETGRNEGGSQVARVVLEHVSKRFGNVTAVDQFSLEIEDREFLVLLGPSGCGKTTTLRMVAGLEEPSAGRILIGERDVTYLEPKDRDIAMVFQNYALYPHMTVYENMAFGLKLRHLPRPEIDRRVKEAAEILGLGQLLHRKPKELSGGQRQRVALGRAIVREPKAFLMDEPLSNLDAKLRAQTRVELKRLHQRLESTVIYVTHDQTEAMTMGTRIVVMRDGVVQQVDTPEGIYHRPVNQFVATFVGTPAMNLLPGEVSREGDTWWITLSGGARLQAPATVVPRLAKLSDRRVTLGIRPGDVYAEPREGPQLSAEVRVFEHMGHENMLYLAVSDDVSLVARTDYTFVVKPGDRVTVTLDPERLHVFDPATEQAVTV
jgi:multiple sugar transport system ATP-binding protein